jgi:hypothetical protein
VHTRFTAMPEAVIGGLLVAGSITVFATNFFRFFETDLFGAILLIQSLPFLSAVTVACWSVSVDQANLHETALRRRPGQMVRGIPL